MNPLSTVQYPQVKVSGQNGKRHKTRPVCPISLQFSSPCWSVSWDDAHQILFSLDKNSLSESIYTVMDRIQTYCIVTLLSPGKFPILCSLFYWLSNKQFWP